MPGDERPKAVDLYCGAGGLALGFEQAGFDIVAAADYDPVHAAVHSFNFPYCRTLARDLTSTSSEDLTGPLGDDEIHVVIGGPPCQGFSLIGKRLVDDERNQLVFHFLRLVEEIAPKYFVMENVPGMNTGDHTGILDQLIKEFEGIGYSIRRPVQTLNAANFGVPQDRERLFLIGARDGTDLPSYPSPTHQPVPKRPGDEAAQNLPMLPEGPTVADAIGDLPNLDAFSELLETDEVELSSETVERMREQEGNYAKTLRNPAEDDENYSHPRFWDSSLLTSSNRTQHQEKSIRRFEETAPGTTEGISRFYRLHKDGLCNTLRAGTSSARGAFTSARPIHPTLPRVISVREAARLHSFPDWFRFHRTKWHGFRQVGNSVPPLLARRIAAELISSTDFTPRRPQRTLQLGSPELLSFSMTEAADYFDAATEEIPAPRQRSAAG